MTRLRTIAMTAVCTAIAATAVAFVVIRCQRSMDAYDSILVSARIYHAYLGVLDTDQMTAEQKVARLRDSTSARLAIGLAGLRGFARCQFTLPSSDGYYVTAKDREKTIRRIETYLLERRERKD